jgi:hypothetical protein
MLGMSVCTYNFSYTRVYEKVSAAYRHTLHTGIRTQPEQHMACSCILNSAYGVSLYTVLRMHTGCIPMQRRPAYVICPSAKDILHIREHVFVNLT